MTRILLHFLPSWDNGMELVTTNSSIDELDILSIAGPDSTGCVIYALTLAAPSFLRASTALH